MDGTGKVHAKLVDGCLHTNTLSKTYTQHADTQTTYYLSYKDMQKTKSQFDVLKTGPKVSIPPVKRSVTDAVIDRLDAHRDTTPKVQSSNLMCN